MSNLSANQFVMPKEQYVNVAMQMMLPSGASNTASGTKA